MFVPIIKYEAACLFEIEEKLSPNLSSRVISYSFKRPVKNPIYNW